MLTWKFDHNLPHSIKPEDIIPLVNLISHSAWDNVNNNNKAVLDCGWNPLNRKLAEHSSVAPATTDASLTISAHSNDAISLLTALNMEGEEGVMSTVIDCIIKHQMALDGSKRAYKKRKLKREDAKKGIKDTKETHIWNHEQS